jgi:hypothetical protein
LIPPPRRSSRRKCWVVINVDPKLNDAEAGLLYDVSPSGDLMDLARGMREKGVESLLFAGPDGRITRVVTDRQVAHLAESPVAESPAQPLAEAQVGPPSAVPVDDPALPSVPAQQHPAARAKSTRWVSSQSLDR